MGRTCPLLVAAFVCIVLTSQVAVTSATKTDVTSHEGVDEDVEDKQLKSADESPLIKTSSANNNSTPAAQSATVQQPSVREQGKIQLHGEVQGNQVVFNWSQTTGSSLDASEYEIRYKTELLACNFDMNYTPWSSRTSKSMVIIRKPYSNVTVQVRIKNTNKVAAKSVLIPAAEPTTKVTRLVYDQKVIIATVQNDCTKYNGPNMQMLFVLKVNGEVQKNSTLKTTGNTARLDLKKLLQPFTNYTVTAIPANDNGATTNNALTQNIAFKTNPGKPGKVRNLKVVKASSNSLEVTWNAPNDNPPKGILQKFIVRCRPLPPLTGGGSRKYVNEIKENISSLVFSGLSSNAAYEISVQAKNKGSGQRSDPVTVISNTTEERASMPVVDLENTPTSPPHSSTAFPVVDLKNTPTSPPHSSTPLYVVNLKSMADNTTLHWSWGTSGKDTVALYTVSLHEGGTLIEKISTSETTAIFHNLTAGKKYEAWVRACSEGGKCGNNTKDEAWTRPNPPKVKKEMLSLESSDSTVTIQLPILENPPGKHWVLLKRNSGGHEGRKEEAENLKEKAKKIVQQAKKTEKETVRQNTTYHNRARRSADKFPGNDMELHIVKVIEVEASWDGSQESVTLGENQPLMSDSNYTVVVVTETIAGDYSEYSTCEPIKFKTKPYRGEMATLGLIGGICAAAVVLMVVCTLLVVGCNDRRRRKSLQVENNSQFMEGSVLNVIVHDSDKIPLKYAMNGRILTENDKRLIEEQLKVTQGLDKDVVQEDVYMNINHEVKRKDLEMYLPKAMFSSETTMEFNSVPFFVPGKTASESIIPENVRKNRYRNDVCYDDTRVKMPLFNKIPHSDYINANFVQDPSGRNSFIATQGPKDHNENTIGAFWRMIWHTKCSMILMVANLMEGGTAKVAQYWPETQPLVTEGVKVTLTSVRTVMDFVVRTFAVVVDDVEREVTQYQYTAWPDHGVPQTAYGLGHMLKIVIRDYAVGLGGPITVHCSAGIGRTGTIILTLFLLRQLDAFNVINTREALLTLRKGRGRLVENMEQYIFVHKLLNEILFGIKTTFSCDSFVKEVAALRSSKAPDGTSLLQKQFQKIKALPKDLTFKFGKDPACAHLNRNQEILPADNRMVFVQMRGEGVDAQYLNVVQINGFDRKDAYLAGEHPQPHTLAKMWRLVFEQKVSVWMLLQELPRNDPSFPDVVRKSLPLQSNMTVTVSQPNHFDNFTEYSVSLTVKERESSERHQCTLLMLKGWSHAAKLPPSPATLLGAIEKAESCVSPESRLLLTCSDGVTGCGVMAALLLATSRAKLTQEVDLYRSVVSVNYDRPQFIIDSEQYQFLHTAMGAFLDANKHYGNFV